MEDIFNKIKALRTKRGMTLRELSEKTGFSVSFLSQIERGTSSLAITSLRKIAHALGETMVYFFEESDDINYAIYKGDQKSFRVGSSDTTFTRLSNYSDRKFDSFIITLDPYHKDPEFVEHAGEEFYYIISGVVTIYIEDKVYHLSKGDSIHFPSTTSHKWENPSENETVIISTVTPVVFN